MREWCNTIITIEGSGTMVLWICCDSGVVPQSVCVCCCVCEFMCVFVCVVCVCVGMGGGCVS